MNAPHHHLHKVELQTRDYKDNVTPFWCPGCGHHGVLTGVFKALADLGVDPTYLVNISGIGCSSRLPYFIRSYRMHTLHGRAGPVATGTHLARPELPILITGGEGDAFWELFSELPTRGPSDRQPIGLLGTHAVVLR